LYLEKRQNMFLKKQNSMVDYEVKMEEFVYEKSDKSDTRTQSKLPSPKYENNNSSGCEIIKTKQIFKIEKEGGINTTNNTNLNLNYDKTHLNSQNQNQKNKQLTKEELINHPFLTSSSIKTHPPCRFSIASP